MDAGSFSERELDVEGRHFGIRTVRFENGFFISVTEGADRMGSMVASLATGPSPVTTTIIPSRADALFLKLVSERVSTRMRGMALVSAYLQKEADPVTAKALMGQIMEMVERD